MKMSMVFTGLATITASATAAGFGVQRAASGDVPMCFSAMGLGLLGLRSGSVELGVGMRGGAPRETAPPPSQDEEGMGHR